MRRFALPPAPSPKGEGVLFYSAGGRSPPHPSCLQGAGCLPERGRGGAFAKQKPQRGLTDRLETPQEEKTSPLPLGRGLGVGPLILYTACRIRCRIFLCSQFRSPDISTALSVLSHRTPDRTSMCSHFRSRIPSAYRRSIFR